MNCGVDECTCDVAFSESLLFQRWAAVNQIPSIILTLRLAEEISL